MTAKSVKSGGESVEWQRGARTCASRLPRDAEERAGSARASRSWSKAPLEARLSAGDKLPCAAGRGDPSRMPQCRRCHRRAWHARRDGPWHAPRSASSTVCRAYAGVAALAAFVRFVKLLKPNEKSAVQVTRAHAPPGGCFRRPLGFLLLVAHRLLLPTARRFRIRSANCCGAPRQSPPRSSRRMHCRCSLRQRGSSAATPCGPSLHCRLSFLPPSQRTMA